MCETKKTDTKPKAADTCSWQGDSPESELDDLAHDHNRQPAETCSWHGDSPEPEIDDLAHDSRPRATSHTEPKVVVIVPVPSDTPVETEKPKKPEDRKKTSKTPPKG